MEQSNFSIMIPIIVFLMFCATCVGMLTTLEAEQKLAAAETQMTYLQQQVDVMAKACNSPIVEHYNKVNELMEKLNGS